MYCIFYKINVSAHQLHSVTQTHKDTLVNTARVWYKSLLWLPVVVLDVFCTLQSDLPANMTSNKPSLDVLSKHRMHLMHVSRAQCVGQNKENSSVFRRTMCFVNINKKTNKKQQFAHHISSVQCATTAIMTKLIKNNTAISHYLTAFNC